MADLQDVIIRLQAAQESNGLAGSKFTGTQDDLAACLTELDSLPNNLATVLDSINTQRDNNVGTLAVVDETTTHLQQADERNTLEETRNALALVEHQKESANIILAHLDESKEAVEAAIAQLEKANSAVQIANAQANEADRSVGGAAENITQALARLNG